jgi:hypothetical protein
MENGHCGSRPRMPAHYHSNLDDASQSALLLVDGAASSTSCATWPDRYPVLVIAELLGLTADDRGAVPGVVRRHRGRNGAPSRSGRSGVLTCDPPLSAGADRVLPGVDPPTQGPAKGRSDQCDAGRPGAGAIASTEELLATCVLLLFAGHEATAPIRPNGSTGSDWPGSAPSPCIRVNKVARNSTSVDTTSSVRRSDCRSSIASSVTTKSCMSSTSLRLNTSPFTSPVLVELVVRPRPGRRAAPLA